jgi:putative ABC transport system permease protein
LALSSGIGGAIGLTRYLQTMLYGVTSLDCSTFAVVAAAFATIATAAFVPARRATAGDPVVALRRE